jgi:hypothetical protein
MHYTTISDAVNVAHSADKDFRIMVEQPPRRRNRKRHVDDDVVSEIRAIVGLRGKTPASIREELMLSKKFSADMIPSIDTIRRMKKDIEHEDETGVWNWTEEDPERIHLVLDTLGIVNQQTKGRVQSFTKQQANRIYRIRFAFPAIDPMWAYMIATNMTGDTGGGARVDNATGILMYQPWKNQLWQERYHNAIRQGWVPKGPPLALSLDSDGHVAVVDTWTALTSFMSAIHSAYEGDIPSDPVHRDPSGSFVDSDNS